MSTHFEAYLLTFGRKHEDKRCVDVILTVSFFIIALMVYSLPQSAMRPLAAQMRNNSATKCNDPQWPKQSN